MGRQNGTSATVARIAAGLSLAAGLACLAGAGEARAAVTGTGGGPETTITAPHTRPSGQTVPPGASAAPTHDPEARTERHRELDRVLNGICRGC